MHTVREKIRRAAQKGQISYLVEMIKKTNDQSLLCFDEGTALTILYEANQINKISRLIDIGVSPNLKDGFNKTILHAVASNGDIKTIEWLIFKGADLNIKDRFGRTPFHTSLFFDHGVQFYEKLISMGGDFEVVTSKGENALDISSRYGVKESLEKAVEKIKKRDMRNVFDCPTL